MSSLEQALKNANQELEKSPVARNRKRNNPLGVKPVILIGVAFLTFLSFNNLSSWIFGVPDETIQADIITLLKYTDDKLQRNYSVNGDYPITLPNDTPSRIVSFKRTLAGYKLDAQIHDVHVLLERRGDVIETRRTAPNP
ncbi:MAG: hypothetical protein ACI9FB_000608 [Candidatus Azotimanducaceae bacterium]|jgi:hypothetical protein